MRNMDLESDPIVTDSGRRQNRGRAQETRNRILRTAEQCFIRLGYERAGVAEICRSAGISKGALYHHFATKQAIFVELFETYMNGLITEMEKIQEQSPSVPEAMRRLVAMAGVVLKSAADRLPLFFDFLTKAAREPEIWKATTAPYRQFREFYTRLLSRGIAEGSLKPVDPVSTAQIIVCYGVGLVTQGVFDPTGADWLETGMRGMNLILDSITKGESK
jgi:AcrR family transcriptional regulator